MYTIKREKYSNIAKFSEMYSTNKVFKKSRHTYKKRESVDRWKNGNPIKGVVYEKKLKYIIFFNKANT